MLGGTLWPGMSATHDLVRLMLPPRISSMAELQLQEQTKEQNWSARAAKTTGIEEYSEASATIVSEERNVNNTALGDLLIEDTDRVLCR